MEKHAPAPGRGGPLRTRLRRLYYGASAGAVRFRIAVLVVDFALIAFFIAAPLLKDAGWAFYTLDYVIAAVLAADLAARGYAYGDWGKWFRRPITWVDLFVLVTLLAPAWLFNLGFLRILRLWSLLSSDHFWRTVGRRYDDTRVEDVTRAMAALVTFVFIATGFVYTAFAGRGTDVHGYVDALYFTVTTLSTTGYGDVILPGVGGRLLSIAIMLVGVTLFIRLGQALFRGEGKIYAACRGCGLLRHEPDARFCRGCGRPLSRESGVRGPGVTKL
ncbi:MAG: potassium channel family protein [Caulobacteraceae bacterium]|nr:potassium channel family protein [Caulobacteraceae bacterium]